MTHPEERWEESNGRHVQKHTNGKGGNNNSNDRKVSGRRNHSSCCEPHYFPIAPKIYSEPQHTND